jgi:predicted DCC family thiol-disulfide oxidoreductase YuxK
LTDQTRDTRRSQIPDGFHPIILYDGVCGLCDRLVQFILRCDGDAVFRFASLQSTFAVKILTRHGANPTHLDTFYVVVDHQEAHEGAELVARSAAIVYVLKRLGGIWSIAAFIVDFLPHSFRDWIYNVVAKNRYRIFGRYDSCPLPSEETRARFLDL